MAWGHLGLSRLLSLPAKAPLDITVHKKFNKEREKAKERAETLNTQLFPSPSLPQHDPGPRASVLASQPPAPMDWPQGHLPILPTMPLTSCGVVCTTPSTVWGEESAWYGSSCEAPRGFPGLPTPFLALWAASAAAGTPGPSGIVVSRASCVGLGWHPVLPPGLEVPHGPPVPIPFLSSHTSSKNHHYKVCFVVLI